MAEKKCPQCAMMIPAEAKVCGHCRYKFPTGGGWKVFLVLLGLCGLVMICQESRNSSAPGGGASGRTREQDSLRAALRENYWAEENRQRDVVVLVKGTGEKASFYCDVGDENINLSEVSLPYKAKWKASKGVQFYVSSQIGDPLSETIRLYFIVDGDTIERAKASGDYAIASLSATVP